MRLTVLCFLGLCLVVLSPAIGWCGVPCPDASTIEAAGNGDCTPGATVCPAGDYDAVQVTVIVRDCYGTPVSGINVEVHPFTSNGSFYFCAGESIKTGISNASGVVIVTYDRFGGCGDLQFEAEGNSVILGSSAAIRIASMDCSEPDGAIGLLDFITFATVYRSSDPCCDLNCDGIVNLTDFVHFASLYNHACP